MNSATNQKEKNLTVTNTVTSQTSRESNIVGTFSKVYPKHVSEPKARGLSGVVWISN